MVKEEVCRIKGDMGGVNTASQNTHGKEKQKQTHMCQHTVNWQAGEENKTVQVHTGVPTSWPTLGHSQPVGATALAGMMII